MRDVLKRSTPVKANRRNKAWAKGLWFLAGLMGLFVALGMLSHLKNVTIGSVEVFGLEIVNKDEVSQSVLEHLQDNKALIYASGNIFIYSKNDITTFIKEKFPRIYRVKSIERFKRNLTIKLEERQAVLTWCGQHPPVYEKRFEDQDCYFIDQYGFIFGKAPFFTPGVYLMVYGGINPDIETIGQTLKIKNSVMDYIDLSKALLVEDIPIHSLVINPDGQNALFLNIPSKTNDFIKILFNEDRSLDELLNKIHSTISEETFLKQYRDNSNGLLYVDTRFDNRVFYKFQDLP